MRFLPLALFDLLAEFAFGGGAGVVRLLLLLLLLLLLVVVVVVLLGVSDAVGKGSSRSTGNTTAVSFRLRYSCIRSASFFNVSLQS